MGLNMTSIVLFLRLLSEGIGVSEQIATIARRIQNGEEVTDEEIKAGMKEATIAKDNWDKAAQPKLIQNNPTALNGEVPYNEVSLNDS